MNTYFQLDENSNILIYGAASIGIIAYNIFKEKNIPVRGFIDKRGDEIVQLCGLKVWCLEDEDIKALDKNFVVFVGVKNVFEHDNIVRKLLEYGFNNIIYRPYSVIKGEGKIEEKKLNEIYDAIMNRNIKVSGDPIPKTFNVQSYDFKDYSVIKSDESIKTVYVPIESLFTDNKEVKERWGWTNIPVLTLIPHIDFFKYLDGQNEYSYHRYLDYCVAFAQSTGQIKITDLWKENVIKNRADVYSNMNLSLERDYDFFLRNAPTGEWNPKGYFNLVSGKHRAAFFLAKGKQFFPLKISVDDFNSWVNKPFLDKLINRFFELDLHESHAPIEHPYFYDLKCVDRSFWYRLLCSFMYNIALYQYESVHNIALSELGGVIISLNDDGYIARNLQKYGMGVKVYNTSILGEILNELLLIKRNNAKNLEYAVIEYKFGTEIPFENIIDQDLKCVVVIVQLGDLSEFEIKLNRKFDVIRICDGYKNGECVKVYWLEKTDYKRV